MAMTTQQFLLIKLAEEAAELSQMALKASQFGLHEIKPGQNETNLDRIKSEFRDVLTHAHMLDLEIGTDLHSLDGLFEHIEGKEGKVRKFLRYSQRLGEVEPWPVASRKQKSRQ